ncbi:MAG: RNA methyltransferase [Bacteroidota bacterium]
MDVDNINEKEALLGFLRSFISESRNRKFDENIRYRTRYMTIVLEDIFQSHNASAVLRSCDCFGIQDVHIIENENIYEVNPDVALGSSKWLSMSKYNSATHNTIQCISHLKEQGYKIVATSPHENDFSPDNLPLDQKFALVFGTELKGLTKEAFESADAYIKIPMVGFTESLNISVSAALLLYSLSDRLRNSNHPWRLTKEEETEVLLQWTRSSIRRSAILEKEFLRKFKNEDAGI